MYYQDPIMSFPIANGVKYLDENMPGWFREFTPDSGVKAINLGTLDIEHPHECIMGQLFGGYAKGLKALCLDYHNGERMGFAVPEQTNIRDYNLIYEAYTREWTDVITARRAAGV